MRIVTLFASIILLFTLQSAHSVEAAGEIQGVTNSPDSDHRQLVSMPNETSQLMREDMLDHLSALNEIIGLLAENNLDAAADLANSCRSHRFDWQVELFTQTYNNVSLRP